MPILQPISIAEAAHELGLSAARVRAMAAAGQLPAEKIGGRWVVEKSYVRQRKEEGGLPGRRFTAMNAWALLVIASDGYFSPEDGTTSVDDVLLPHISPSVRSRLKRLLLSEGLEGLAPRLSARAEVIQFRAHPGEISHVASDSALMATGVSGAARVRLISSKEVDGYLSARDLRPFVERHVLSESPPHGNVCLRAVPEEVWSIFGGKTLAPMASVALDLMNGWGPRTREIGREWIRSIDRENRKLAKGR